MARPTKQGVDYFPLDVHLDNKFKFIEIKFGLEGFAVVIKILQNIYSQGYWTYWGEDEKLLFSDENKIDYEQLEKITDECTKRDIFDQNIYETYSVLTSRGIQSRYKEIVRRRKEVIVVKDYLLVDGDFGVNDNINEVNDDINPTRSKPSDNKSAQSKVKESKTKENKTRSKLKFETHHLQLAELLFKKIKENNPDAKEPNLESWANTFRLMMEVPKEKRSGKDIQDIILWSQSNHFWYKNILSADKLRKQFDRLFVEMKDEQNKPFKNNVIQIPNYGGGSNGNGTSNEQHSKKFGDVKLYK